MALPLPAGTTLIPDDLFGLQGTDEKGDWYRFFAVEIDRNTESIERKNLEANTFGRKITNYLTVLRTRLFKSHWGLPNLTVLTVTTNATHARNILDFVERQNAPEFQERFAFQFYPDFGSNWRVPKTALGSLLTEPWVTATSTEDITRP